MPKLHFHGHSTFRITTDDGTVLLIDPSFDDNPAADMSAADVEGIHYVLVTHGHADHFSDALSICKRTGAKLISSYEIVAYAKTRGIDNGHMLSIGGAYRFPFGRVKMTPAVHGSSVVGEGAEGFTSSAGGFLITLGDKGIYFAGDTGLTMDMQLIRGEVDIAVLPIGDNFTMGPEDAARAVEFIEPSVVIPFHYRAWDLIQQDPAVFTKLVGDRARVELMDPGSHYIF